MMEVQRHSVQSVRRSDKIFNPEGVPPVSTGLSLGVHGIDSTNATSPLPGYISPVTSMRTPLPNVTVGGYETQPPMVNAAVNASHSIPTPPLVPVGAGEFMSLSPPGIISGNQAVFLSPSVELPPSVPTAGEMALDVPFELRPDNEVIVSRGFNQSLSRSVAAPDTEKATRDVDLQLSMATEPDSLEASKPDLNFGYNDGETQLVSESQSGVDVMEPPLAGETQPVNDEGFDDTVMLQNNTLTASTMPMENDDQPASLYEPLQIIDTPPLEAFLDVTTPTPSGITELKVSSNRDKLDTGKDIGVEPHINKLSSGEPDVEGQKERALGTGGPAAIGGQAHKEEGLDTFKPQVQDRLLETVHDKENKGDHTKPMGNSNAGNAITKKKEVVMEQDIQAIIGRKLMKKFGRKNYEGEVVDYDTENQWFKVVYEDGDQEDLDLVEVTEILLTWDTISDTPTSKRKKAIAKGGPRKQARKHKTESQESKKSRGRPKKKGSSTQTKKKSRKVKYSQKSKPEGSKTGTLPTKRIDAGEETDPQLQAKSRGKRKRSSDVETEDKTRTGAKVKKGGTNRLPSTKTSIRKSSPKAGGRKLTKKDSAKRKGMRRRSLSSLPAEQNRDKRRKVDLESFVGNIVEKDFDGTLYKGEVMKFDSETNYYKVKYEDGDEEDLELEELKVVLVD